MGLSSSKNKTEQKTNQTETGTSMPVTPEWLTAGAQDYTDRIAAFGDMDPTGFVAPASPLQQQAWGNVGQLDNWKAPATQAADLATSAAGAGPFLAGAPMMQPAQGQAPGKVFGRSTGLALPRAGGIQDYAAPPSNPGYAMPRTGQPIGATPNPAITGASQAPAYSNPFDQQVIDPTLAGYDQDAGERRAQLSAAGARNLAFGGSRFGLAEGQFDADTALGRAQMEGGLRQTGFNTANQFGMQDAASGNNMLQFNANQQDEAAQRELQAAGLFGGLTDTIGANTRADLGTMAGLGDQQRGIEQGYAMAPLAQLEAMGGLMGATPYDILVGRNVTGNTTGTSTTTQTAKPSLFSQMLQLGQMGAQAYAGGMGGY